MISVSGRVISGIFGVASVAIMARYLGKSGFGEYNIILAFLYIVLALSDFGLYSILTREISKPGADEKKIISGIFGFRILSLFLFFLTSFIALWFLPYPFIVKIGILIASPGFVFMSASQLLMGVFQKYLKTLWPAIGDIIARGSQLLLVILFAAGKMSFLYFVLAISLSGFLSFMANLFFARKFVKFSINIDYSFIKEIFKKSWPLAVYSVLTLVYFKMDLFLLSLMKPPSDVGVYSAAYKVFEGLLFFPAAFSGLMLPLMSGSAHDSEKFRIFFKKAFDFLVIASLPLVVGGIILSQKIAFLIGGSEFGEASWPIRLLMPALFFVFLGNLLGNAVIALDKQRKMIYVSLLGVFISITFNLILIPRYSYLATSFTTLLTEVAVNSVLFFIILKEIRIWPIGSRFLKAIFSSAIMGAAVLYLNFLNFNIFILIITGAAVYAGAIFFLKGITKEEFKHIILRQEPQSII